MQVNVQIHSEVKNLGLKISKKGEHLNQSVISHYEAFCRDQENERESDWSDQNLVFVHFSSTDALLNAAD